MLVGIPHPDAPGVEIVGRLRDLAPAIPIVAVGEADDPQVGPAVLQQGAQDYMDRGRLDAPLLAGRVGQAVEQKRGALRLERMAFEDPLTGLANRTVLLDRLGRALIRLERHPGSVAVLFLDLDRFKAVNDRWGHGGGDRVLSALAERLGAVVRTSETVASIGGDEFVVLCEDVGTLADAGCSSTGRSSGG